MTVTYTAEVATCRGFGCFLKLLARWRGSIYKLVWMDLIAFLLIYYCLSCIYRYALDVHQKEMFESIVHYCNSYGALIPLSFVLGFYVSIVMTRWWDQYMTIPWPDPVAVFVSAHVHGQDERGRVMRRTVMRYVCLCLTMVLINMSPRVKKRFPTLDHLVDAGLLVESEKLVIQSMDQKFPKHPKNWMPIVWASSIITRARKEGRIRDDFSLKTVIDELNKFRGMCTVLMHYDAISIPLVYTQVVTLAVYSYFLSNVMGKQWVDRADDQGYYNTVDYYFPIFTTLEFFFYMGWLKVAESLINPFGEDDDDFEVNWLIDRNLQVSYLIVDEMHHEHPELIKDQYWDEVFPNELPYANENENREEPPEPSTARVDVTKSALPVSLSTIKVDAAPESANQVNGKMRSHSSLMRKPPDVARDSENQQYKSHSSSIISISSAQPASSTLTNILTPPPERQEPKKLAIKSSVTDTRSESEKTDESQTRQKQETPAETSTATEKFGVEKQLSSTSFKTLRQESSSDGADDDSSKDDFERLRKERERERLERRKQKLARTIGTATGEIGTQPSTAPTPTPTSTPAATSTPTTTAQQPTSAPTTSATTSMASFISTYDDEDATTSDPNEDRKQQEKK